MSHSSVEIANEFLRLANGRLTQMQIQKLAYIAHGWNLVINGEPLISETPKAWPYGPVYPELYEHTKLFGRQIIGREITPDDSAPARFFGKSSTGVPPYRAQLSNAELGLINAVWNRYGNLSAIKLSELTHQPNTPWFQAYSMGQGSSLTNEVIRDHYLDLARRSQVAPQ